MQIKQLLDARPGAVISLPCSKSVADAARALMAHYVGALVVTNDMGEVMGVLSERDIAVAVALYPAELESVEIKDVMTGKVLTCSPHDSVKRVADLMIENDVRHIPVVDGADVVRMISMRDLFRVLDENFGIAVA